MATAIKIERWRGNLFRRVTALAQRHNSYAVAIRLTDIAGLLDEAGETFEFFVMSFRHFWGIDVFRTTVSDDVPCEAVVFQQYGVSGYPAHVETLFERSRWR